MWQSHAFAQGHEITTLSSITRDDVVYHREWAATMQTSLRGEKRQWEFYLKQKVEIATLPSVTRNDSALLEVIVHQQVACDDNFLKKRSSDLLARRGKDADLKKMGTVLFSPYFKKRGTVPFFRGVFKKSACFMNNSGEISRFNPWKERI